MFYPEHALKLLKEVNHHSLEGRSDDDLIEELRSMNSAFAMTKQRCYNKNCKDYAYYGGRGVTIQKSWMETDFEFVLDMGVRPKGDRKSVV